MARRVKPKQRSLAPLFLIGAGVILLLGVLIYSALAGGANGVAAGNQDIPFPEIERVSLADAGRALDDQNALFLDVRDADSFQARHVRGAVNIPIGELERRAGELDKNRWIIPYCT